jgi:hypothetical protein
MIEFSAGRASVLRGNPACPPERASNVHPSGANGGSRVAPRRRLNSIVALACALGLVGCAAGQRAQPTISVISPEQGTTNDTLLTRWRANREGQCSLAGASAPFVYDDTDNVDAFTPEQAERAKVIWGIVDQRIREIEACYQEALTRNRNLIRQHILSGRLSCNFVVAPEGDVLWSNVDSSDVRSEYLKSCMTTAICGWSFPPAPRSEMVLVEFPMTLQPVRGIPMQRRYVRLH